MAQVSVLPLPETGRPPLAGVGRLGSSINITRLAALTGVTARALRYYEEIGLLEPARGSRTRREFGPQECEKALLIVRLRRIGVDVRDIRRLLDPALGPDQRRREILALVEARRRHLDEQIAFLERIRSGLEAPSAGRRQAERPAGAGRLRRCAS